MWDWITGLMGGGNASGMDTGFASQTGTPDGVGPVMGGIREPMGDYTDEQLRGMRKQQPMGSNYMNAGTGMSRPQQMPTDGIGGLMAMATRNANKPYQKSQMPMNEYVRGLMMRGM